MNNNEITKAKNKFLCIVLGAIILLRGITNGYFVGYKACLIYIIAGILISLLLLVLSKYIPNAHITMYIITFTMAFICFGLMAVWPAKINYLMFLIAIVYASIYEELLPVTIECICAVISMIVFYIKFKDILSMPWKAETSVLLVVYIISIYVALIYKSYLSKKETNELNRISTENIHANNKTNDIINKIKASVTTLVDSNLKIKQSINTSDEISNHIGSASGDVSREAASEVESLEKIRSLVNNGVDQISSVREASTSMTEYSVSTENVVLSSSAMASGLSDEVSKLSKTMDEIVAAMNSLCDENDKIFNILSTLNDITAQTNLLSLNASIEAARAGEHGKGFAVVAEQIRILADSSKAFTNEINSILKGVSGQTELLTVKVLNQQKLLSNCNDNAILVKQSFENVSHNTSQILAHSRDVEDKSESLAKLFDTTLTGVNDISDNVETTAAAMQEITASILELHGNISNIVNEYHEISQITENLANI